MNFRIDVIFGKKLKIFLKVKVFFRIKCDCLQVKTNCRCKQIFQATGHGVEGVPIPASRPS